MQNCRVNASSVSSCDWLKCVGGDDVNGSSSSNGNWMRMREGISVEPIELAARGILYVFFLFLFIALAGIAHTIDYRMCVWKICDFGYDIRAVCVCACVCVAGIDIDDGNSVIVCGDVCIVKSKSWTLYNCPKTRQKKSGNWQHCGQLEYNWETPPTTAQHQNQQQQWSEVKRNITRRRRREKEKKNGRWLKCISTLYVSHPTKWVTGNNNRSNAVAVTSHRQFLWVSACLSACVCVWLFQKQQSILFIWFIEFILSSSWSF